ncbi:uncharacterized protein LOC118201340 [Stegodyphus dumicola]|uniref:uncharacterized protein LOC118201340 n=1 Tax=Stegodyphus dumicola TaxID=202533 RepID=UPI0015A9CCFA|nr:uncharacterized protein LOC118201340 [Stegodyphus dumicola]
MNEPELLVSLQNPINLKLFWINLDLSQKVAKSNTDPSILRASAFEVLNIFYPEPEWLRIFTDDPSCLMALMQVPEFSTKFSFYLSVDRGSVFDGEIAAIRTALYQLPCHLEKFTRAVILSDSRAALLAIISDKYPISQDILDCRHYLKTLASLEKSIIPQWVPACCGVPGNEKADFLAKKGAYHAEYFSSFAFPYCKGSY